MKKRFLLASNERLAALSPEAVAYGYVAPNKERRALAHRLDLLLREPRTLQVPARATPLLRNIGMVRRFVRRTIAL